jgi:CRISPR-associated protein Cas2
MRCCIVRGCSIWKRLPADAKWYLVCYDVRDAKRLHKVAKHLEGYGSRAQYSVFRCWLSAGQMQKLRWELTQLMDSVDELLMIPLCAQCVAGMEAAHSATHRPRWPDTPVTHKIV